jgi:hypothetical protein
VFLSITVATPFAAAPSRRKPGGARPGRDWPVAGQWRMRGQPGANQTWRIACTVWTRSTASSHPAVYDQLVDWLLWGG